MVNDVQIEYPNLRRSPEGDLEQFAKGKRKSDDVQKSTQTLTTNEDDGLDDE